VAVPLSRAPPSGCGGGDARAPGCSDSSAHCNGCAGGAGRDDGARRVELDGQDGHFLRVGKWPSSWSENDHLGLASIGGAHDFDRAADGSGLVKLTEVSGITYDTTVNESRIVLDTCVLVSALRSRRGASFRVLELIDSGRFEVCLSITLLLEYEAVCKRLPGATPLTKADVETVLDYVCLVAQHQTVFYLWRPFLNDPSDDMVLELAVAGGCGRIVTHNVRDFHGSNQFGIRTITPQEFLRELGEIA
jgi:predicted nucleic acid-binding protein